MASELEPFDALPPPDPPIGFEPPLARALEALVPPVAAVEALVPVPPLAEALDALVPPVVAVVAAEAFAPVPPFPLPPLLFDPLALPPALLAVRLELAELPPPVPPLEFALPPSLPSFPMALVVLEVVRLLARPPVAKSVSRCSVESEAAPPPFADPSLALSELALLQAINRVRGIGRATSNCVWRRMLLNIGNLPGGST